MSSLSAGWLHTCAVMDAGGLKCWGRNTYGQLGDNTQTHRNTPLGVVGLTGGVLQVAGGQAHTCAVTTSGAAKCWGLGTSGQLGNRSAAGSFIPSDVYDMSVGVTAIAAGKNHNCAVVGRAIKCWGGNPGGELGDGSTGNTRLAPVSVVGLSGVVSSLAAGGDHTCAVVDGAAKCWGWNYYGQIGDGSTVQKNAPVAVSGASTPAFWRYTSRFRL